MDLADNFNEKKQHDEARNNFDRVLTVIYQLGRNGHQAVSLKTLQQYAGLEKLDVLSVIEEATGKDWTIDTGTNVVAITTEIGILPFAALSCQEAPSFFKDDWHKTPSCNQGGIQS